MIKSSLLLIMTGKIMFVVILVVLLGIVAYFGYNFYLDNSQILQEFIAEPANTSQSSYKNELQFYPNMRFDHNGLSYLIGEECDSKKKADIKSTFDFIENKTILFFYENGKDILINCGEEYEKEELFVAGEGGPSSFVDTGLYNVILEGKIVLLYEKSCNDNIALHELLHVLGFKHSSNPESIMYNISSCKQIVTDDIINEINRLYNIEAMPDLYFSNISAVKHGRYLDLDFTVKNQGLINADKIKVGVLADGKEVEKFDLGLIEFGAGKVMSVTNLKMPSRDVGKIELYINYDGKELNEDNNKIELSLAE